LYARFVLLFRKPIVENGEVINCPDSAMQSANTTNSVDQPYAIINLGNHPKQKAFDTDDREKAGDDTEEEDPPASLEETPSATAIDANVFNVWDSNCTPILSIVRVGEFDATSGKTAVSMAARPVASEPRPVSSLSVNKPHTICIRYNEVDYLPLPFKFVWGKDKKNHHINTFLEPLIRLVRDVHKHVCIILDGYSGSGKSWTLFTQHDSLARFAARIFSSGIQENPITFVAFETRGQDQTDIKFRRAELRNIGVTENCVQYIPGAKHYTVGNVEALIQLLTWTSERRDTDKTKFNKESSRRHLVCAIGVGPPTSAGNNMGWLMLVDLAGAESMDASAQGDESRKINLSRLSLRKLIEDFSAWSRGKKNYLMPFNDSKVSHQRRYFHEDYS
jgi:hypothetical protein